MGKRKPTPKAVSPPSGWIMAKDVTVSGRYVIWDPDPSPADHLLPDLFVADVFQFEGIWRYKPTSVSTYALSGCDALADDFQLLGPAPA